MSDKIGSYLHRGRMRLTAAQKERDRANALVAVFRKEEPVPRGFRRDPLPRTYPEPQLERHERTLRRLFTQD